ncbi:hypothetical protein BU26DRAFT_287870 [Trematosphaeria pertusa]|uniref:Uncharacterized protein n=1 Tax=Trematosphaeria pertusa TaxID=390896 RepID=A0A6A6IH04_9PLEO|nr:uncharacterized protein BU26DRAFT_287870 [Trematosphaeria pertusa]KAF2249696.1 hypothetical protein BU26DRAFT_287870 [Trematosphaeria pertusa]
MLFLRLIRRAAGHAAFDMQPYEAFHVFGFITRSHRLHRIPTGRVENARRGCRRTPSTVYTDARTSTCFTRQAGQIPSKVTRMVTIHSMATPASNALPLTPLSASPVQTPGLRLAHGLIRTESMARRVSRHAACSR